MEKEPAKIPVSAIVNIPNLQLPTILKPALIYLIFEHLKVGDRVEIDGMSYIYMGDN